MCQMRWLHNHTDYPAQVRELRQQFYEAGERWEAGELGDMAEQIVLGEHGGWPARWPWLPQAWSRARHATFDKAFKARVRALLRCLHRALPCDGATRGALCERILVLMTTDAPTRTAAAHARGQGGQGGGGAALGKKKKRARGGGGGGGGAGGAPGGGARSAGVVAAAAAPPPPLPVHAPAPPPPPAPADGGAAGGAAVEASGAGGRPKRQRRAPAAYA
jgi:hypothetical protein